MKAIDGVETRNPDSRRIPMVVSALLREAQNVMADDRSAARDYIAKASHLLGATHSFPAHHDAPPSLPTPHVVRGGLAAWQIGRILHYINDSLNGPIPLRDLSEVAGLSPGYFSRAFKRSFGIPPHAYVMKCRIEHAKVALRTTATPLCHIALDCGLADQAHLSRLFRRLTGETPFAWRRRHGVSAQTM